MLHSVQTLLKALYGEENASLQLLKGCKVRLTPSGDVAYHCTSYFAEVAIEWCGEEYLLMLPLTGDATIELMTKVSGLKSGVLNRLVNYRLLRGEMIYHDSRGEMVQADLILYRLPKGRLLSSVIESGEAVDWAQLIESSYSTQELFTQAKVVHNNLKGSNIIVSEDYQLLPMRYINAEVNATPEQVGDEFDGLRSWLGEKGEVRVDPKPKESRRWRAVSYDSMEGEFDGMRIVLRDGLYGYINHYDDEVIPVQYSFASKFQEGRAEVQLGDKMGLIDLKGEYVIEPCNEIVEYVVELGYVRVKRDNLWAIFDHNGEQIAPFED
ncbi:MAG: WG repeat-containing protein [Rikenellaceae bacterium]